MERAARLELVADESPIELETHVETDGPDGRAIAEPEPDASAQLAQVQLLHPIEDVAAIHEQRSADVAPRRHAWRAVHQQRRVPAGRKPGRAERIRRADGVEGEAADRRV